MSFIVYLSNRNSKKIYEENSCSRFTNDIIPPIVFDTAYKWEVGLISCILPFKDFESNKIMNDIYTFSIQIEFFKTDVINSSLERTIKTYDLNLPAHLFIQKNPKEIYQILIKYLDQKTGSDYNQDFLTFFFGYHKSCFTLTIQNSKSMLRNGNLENVLSISLNINRNMQTLLGLEDSYYKLYGINPLSDGKGRLLIGNKPIQLGMIHPNYIMIYSDIIEPSRFGNQFINILDILPFDNNNFSLDRKLNKLCYKTVNKDIINSISIVIQDPNFNIMKNYSQDCIITIHFRKKNNILILSNLAILYCYIIYNLINKCLVIK